MPVEIEESQLAQYEQLRQTIERVMAHPKASILAERALKEVDANAKTPRLDQLSERDKGLDEIRAELAAEKKARIEETEKRNLDEQRRGIEAKWNEGRDLARQAGYTEDGLKKLEEYMQAEGVFSHKIGMAAYEREHPQAEPIQSGRDFGALEALSQRDGGDDIMKRLFESKGEDERALDSLVSSAINEFRQTPQSRR